MSRYLFTSESVTEGHPDKICRSRFQRFAVLDAVPRPRIPRVARRSARPWSSHRASPSVAGADHHERDRSTFRRSYGPSCIARGRLHRFLEWDSMPTTCSESSAAVENQSPDIAMGVDTSVSKEQGDGDQGLMFGYAEQRDSGS